MAKHLLKNHVFLVGFMGAGKSTAARRLARSCGITSLDLDAYIEREQDKKISDIFTEGGEAAFRNIETSTLQDIADNEYPMVVSCGGGIVISEDNRRIMHDSGTVIHLKVSADEAASRISDKSSRPLFNELEAARKLCESRMPLYEDAADFTIDTSSKSAYQISEEIKRILKREGILCLQQG